VYLCTVNILSVESISKSYGLKVLFEGITFGLSQGEKVALVARNGAGKSSLLRIISGKDKPDTGIVSMRRDLTTEFLHQDPQFDPKKNILEAVLSSNSELIRTVREFEEVSEALAEDPNEVNQLRMQELNSKMDALQAWDLEQRVRTILGKLGFDHFGHKVSTLSGGQIKRLALAQVLVSEPDLLVLDEPTNHLDIDMIEWLEGYITGREMTLLLVTHDRYFLDRVCTRIIELEDGKLFNYDGDFAYYVEKKAEREMQQAAETQKAKNLYRRELEWVRKMPRARGTKQKARKDAFKDVEVKAKGPEKKEALKLESKMTRLGGKILELVRLRKKFISKNHEGQEVEKIILDGFDYTFKRGEKIGIVGKNGSGKSTLLNILLGLEPYDSGKIQTGETVVFGYYSQSGMKMKDDYRVIEVMKEIAEYFPTTDGMKVSASEILERFLFTSQMQYSLVGTLSGGEKRRLYLCTLLMRNPNFLILDEPTNDLDILTLSILEDFLLDFPGCVIIVSHDRYFMDKLVDHLFVFHGEGVIQDFPGNYTQWREKGSQFVPGVPSAPSGVAAPQVKDEVATPVAEKPAATDNRKASFKEKFEFEQLDKEIPKLEAEKKEITAKLETVSDHDELAKLSARFGEIESQLETKTLRWLELSEVVSR
jgi:ATP-binding cassette subfamily F protein uup